MFGRRQTDSQSLATLALERLLEEARQRGYDEGYADACSLVPPASAAAVLPLGGAPQQLGQQRDLGCSA